MTDGTRESLLQSLFDAHADDVLRYATRHIDAATAPDIVSDTFLVAWRRLDEIPEPALPWLLVVARNSIRNRIRSLSRHRRLAGELAAVERAAATAFAAEDLVIERDSLVTALGRLSDQHREALLLVAWDGLSATDAAVVAGCSRPAFEVRLHRARARLRQALFEPDPAPVRPASAPVRPAPAPAPVRPASDLRPEAARS